MTTALAPRLFDPDQELAELLDEPVVRRIDHAPLEAKPGEVNPIEDNIHFIYTIAYFIPWA